MSSLTKTPPAPPARRLYTHRTGLYEAMIGLLRYPQGLARFFAHAAFLRPDLKVLDAGCGTGAVTLALHTALAGRGWQPTHVDAFDLTPSMLSRFRHALHRAAIAGVELAVADVRHLDTLPVAWQDYDLIVSSAMLEYLPKAALPAALQGLRQRLRPDGTLVVFISRRSAFMVPFITKWWHARLYGKTELRAAFQQAGYRNVAFERFPFPYSYLNVWGHVVVARP
ncbi:class I SAM-dependent methyltransferase [Hymenobacter sp. IS2118]|uniref:class I SAM-dependent methyltransferase n=1 Tax=Hymenobacter sp. IS2118 TaxID=1505605 RepID=UPI000689CD09|nr:class I SAM-dependent methyltransferase [Hymenobacter sp. IS2118]